MRHYKTKTGITMVNVSLEVLEERLRQEYNRGFLTGEQVAKKKFDLELDNQKKLADLQAVRVMTEMLDKCSNMVESLARTVLSKNNHL